MKNYTVTVSSESIVCSADNLNAACAALVERYPAEASTLRVVEVRDDAPVAPATMARPSGWGDVIGDSHVDPSAKARIEADNASAAAGGYTLRQPLFATGTLVMQAGVDAAEQYRSAFDRMPSAKAAIEGYREQVRAERREERVADLVGVKMDSTGRIVLPSGERLPITEEAFAQFTVRAGYGGASYLFNSCPPELRALNVNRQGAILAERETERIAEARRINALRRAARMPGRSMSEDARDVRFRTRLDETGTRYVYATVSDGYAEIEADRLADVLLRVVGDTGMKADVRYDGNGLKVQFLGNSDTPAEQYGAGEVFRAGMSFRSDDTGRGRARIGGFLLQNLCLNLQILHRAEQPFAALVHRGDWARLEAALRQGLTQAHDSVEPFLRAWGQARQDVLVPPSPYEGIGIQEITAAWFRGTVEADLVPVVGRKTDAIPMLVKAWEEDTGAGGASGAKAVSRAGLVNAFTRYARNVDAERGDVHDAIVEAASDLLYARRLGGKQSLPTIPFALTEA